MRTLDLINQREEEKNNLPTAVNPLAAPKPAEGTSMEEARMGVDSEEQPSQTATDPVSSISLYEIGKQNSGATNIAQAENTLNGKSPITTPEYERFRNEVIGAQQFGVETEEQRKARERRDFIKQGLTGFTEGLSALANLYYTTKGAPSQQLKSNMPALQQQLYQERLDRDKKLENFRAWQRAKAEKDEERAYQEAIYDKKQKDAVNAAKVKAKYEAAEKAAGREFKVKFEALKHNYKKELAEINDKLKKGQISYQEAIKLANKIAYDNSPGSSAGKVVDSVKGSDGTIWTRNSRITDNEMRQMVMSYGADLSLWTKVKDDGLGNVTETVDYREAFADMAESGMFPPEVLEQMGFKQSKSEKKGKLLPGVEGKKHLNL